MSWPGRRRFCWARRWRAVRQEVSVRRWWSGGVLRRETGQRGPDLSRHLLSSCTSTTSTARLPTPGNAVASSTQPDHRVLGPAHPATSSAGAGYPLGWWVLCSRTNRGGSRPAGYPLECWVLRWCARGRTHNCSGLSGGPVLPSGCHPLSRSVALCRRSVRRRTRRTDLVHKVDPAVARIGHPRKRDKSRSSLRLLGSPLVYRGRTTSRGDLRPSGCHPSSRSGTLCTRSVRRRPRRTDLVHRVAPL